jgi:hypothetical protein
MEIDKVLQRYKENYCRIFESIYPSMGSTGFTERNLSVNFAKAYESVHKDSITWYEFPFDKDRKLHYDALIINPTEKEIVIVESKRFSDTDKKVKEVGEDVNRIHEFQTTYRHEFIDRIPALEEYSVVGVILADVWTEKRAKSILKQSFENKTFLHDYQDKLLIGECPDTWFINGRYFCENFTDIKPSLVYNNACIQEQYHLVGMIWDVRQK